MFISLLFTQLCTPDKPRISPLHQSGSSSGTLRPGSSSCPDLDHAGGHERHSWFYQDSICLPVTSSVTKAYANMFLFIIPQFGQCVTLASGSVLARAQNPSDKEEFSDLFISSRTTNGSTQKGKPAVGWTAIGLHVPSVLKEEESFSTVQYVEADQWELCCLFGWPPLSGADFSFKTCCSAQWTLVLGHKSLFSLAVWPHVMQGLGTSPPTALTACIAM